MTHVVLVAHRPLASALKAVATHVYPDCAATLEALDVEPGAGVEETEARLRSVLDALAGSEVLLLVDVFGATPCSIAAKLADGARVRVVAGVNVPMLWRTLCYGHEKLDALVARALSGATQGVMHVSAVKPQNQNPSATQGRDDQVDHSHQQ